MLSDDKKTKVPGDYDRRWMSDDYFDLIVWYEPSGAVHGFQLCYGKPSWERALTWIKRRGFSHTEVDSGEADPFANLSPILLPNGKFPATKVMREFMRRAGTLPVQLRALVTTKISEFVRKR